MPGWPGRQIAPLARAAGSLFFASPCHVCGADDGPICPGCREELAGSGEARCPRCALLIGPWALTRGGCSWCRGRGLGFDAAEALGPYQGPIRSLCLRMKEERCAWIARWMIDLLIEARGDSIRSHDASLVVAVPLHWRRRLRRGYNQAESLAGHLARGLRMPRIRGLRRVLPTPKLADHGRKERADVMRGAFRASSRVDFRGRTVLLVDDILTTGATCGSAARAIKAAGAAKVVAVVLARAEGRS